ncbi:MAG: hypothetical protein GX575_16620 [Candidatus Anammoximicrobium sp.]|nr:hypothetical protein [Candidatus Anammoximicrobium sp.]
MSDRRFVAGLVLLALVTLALGCGPGRRTTVPVVKVSGEVKLDGQTVSDAEVNFLGQEYAGVAKTGPDGRYELEAQAGENTIYIRKFEGVGPGFDATMMDRRSDAPGGAAGPKQLIPNKYSDPVASELRFTVPDGGSKEANFDLTSR